MVLGTPRWSLLPRLLLVPTILSLLRLAVAEALDSRALPGSPLTEVAREPVRDSGRTNFLPPSGLKGGWSPRPLDLSKGGGGIHHQDV